MERKLAPIDAVEFKFTEARKGFFAGYASKFNGTDAYGDTIAPGAYVKTLESRRSPIQLRWNHRGPVIGKWLTAIEDEKGLYVEGELTPGHSVAEDVYASLKHGSVTGLSIGYRVPEGGAEKMDDGRRLLKSIELVEISVVESPADLDAQISNVKSALESVESLKEIESLLRDAGGFSRADACALVARIKSLAQSDSVPETRMGIGAYLAMQAALTSIR